MKRVPTPARSSDIPVGGTLILLMMPDHFSWPMWVWGSLWTLWIIVWIIVIVDIFTRKEISRSKWESVFKEETK